MKKTILFALATVGMAASAGAQVCVFDDLTAPVGFTDTGGLPRALKGMAFNLGTTGATTINGLDFGIVANATANYANVEVDFSFWNTASLGTSGTGAAFTNRIATYNVTLGAQNLTTGFVYNFAATTNAGPGAVNLGAGFTFAGSTNIGVQELVKVDLGNGLTVSDNLDPALVTNNVPTIGSFAANPAGNVFGFYRNASQANAGLTDPNTSLIGSDFRTFASTTYIGLDMRLYGSAVPEPASMSVLGIGVLAMIRRRRNRKS